MGLHLFLITAVLSDAGHPVVDKTSYLAVVDTPGVDFIHLLLCKLAHFSVYVRVGGCVCVGVRVRVFVTGQTNGSLVTFVV